MDPLLKTGEVVDGWTVEALRANGGNSEVYRVRGAEGELRALKVFLPLGVADEQRRKRFAREAELTIALPEHPNVCRVFATGTDTTREPPLAWLTIEWLGGQTLAERLRARDLDRTEAEDIARSILRGIAHIHSHGVIHRDLKPSNVILGEGERKAVVTDLGLARDLLSEDETTLTATGQAPGTPQWMSPEQREGRRCTAASDLYSFGLIALQLLSGEGPASLTPEEISERVATLESPWRQIVSECLERNPRWRPESAASLLAVLERGSSWYVRRKVRRRAMLAGAVATAIAGGGWLYQERRIRFARGVKVIVAPTGSGDPVVAEQFRRALAQSQYVNVWDHARLEDVWRRMGRSGTPALGEAEWREVAARENARLIALVGSTATAVTVVVEEIGANPLKALRSWSRTFEAPSENARFAALDNAGRWLRDLAGESAREIDQSETTEPVTTQSWAALRAFSEGERLAAANDIERAIRKFQDAAHLDPQFTAAWVRLGDVINMTGNERQAFSAWAHAVETSRSRPMTRREDLYFRAMLASDLGEYGEAENLFATYGTEFSSEPTGPFFRALPLLYLDRVEEAIAVLERTARFESHWARATMQLCWANLHRDRVGPAQALQRELVRRKQVGQAAYAQSVLDYAAGRSEDAMAQLDRAATAGVIERAGAEMWKVIVLGDDAKRWREAIPMAIASADRDADGNPSRRAIKLVSAATLMLEAGDQREAIRILRLIPDSTVGPQLQAHVDALRIRLGEAVQLDGSDVEGEMAARAKFAVRRFRAEGETLLRKGEVSAGLESLRKAARLDPPAYGQEYLARALEMGGYQDESRKEWERSLRQKLFQLRVQTPEPAGSWRRALDKLGRH